MTVTTPLGQVLRDQAGIRLEFVRTYDEPADQVWSALTEPDRLARWMGTVCGDPATGTVELVMSEDEDATRSERHDLELCTADTPRAASTDPRRHLAPVDQTSGAGRINHAPLYPTSRRTLRREQHRTWLALLPRSARGDRSGARRTRRLGRLLPDAERRLRTTRLTPRTSGGATNYHNPQLPADHTRGSGTTGTRRAPRAEPCLPGCLVTGPCGSPLRGVR